MKAGHLEREQMLHIDLPRRSSQHGLCVKVRRKKKKMYAFFFFFSFLPCFSLSKEGWIHHNGNSPLCDIEFHTEKVGRKRHLGMAQTELTESKFSLQVRAHPSIHRKQKTAPTWWVGGDSKDRYLDFLLPAAPGTKPYLIRLPPSTAAMHSCLTGYFSSWAASG